MKKITAKELQAFLRKHKLWLEDDPKGQRANLQGANLQGADLQRADLWGADLWGANLQGANLQGANLQGADLQRADLWGANLQGANLQGANLQGANLWGANLQGANLQRANLWGADLQRADLWGADLQGANLQGANLQRANLWGANLQRADLWGADLWGADLQGANHFDEAKDVYLPLTCPEKGVFTAFKKANGYVVELLIPEDARRSSATTRKCRCDKAMVISITNYDGSDSGLTEIHSEYDNNFVYRVGETVSVDNFDENRWHECAPGIHFFITRDEAVRY